MRCLFMKRCGGFLPGQEYEVGYQQALALIADGAAVEVKDEPPASEPVASPPAWTPPPPSYTPPPSMRPATPPFESDLMD